MAINEPFDAINQQYPEDESSTASLVLNVSTTALGFAGAAGIPHLAFASAVLGAAQRLLPNNRLPRALAFVDELVRRVKQLEQAFERRADEQKATPVQQEDLKAAIQLAMINDANFFDDLKRGRYVSTICNAVVGDTKVTDLVSFIQDIERLNETDILGLKVLNKVMNKSSDWMQVSQSPPANQPTLHPNTFIQRAHELAVQMAKSLGKETDGDRFSREEGLGICMRLQGFGLAQIIQTEARQVPITNYSARLTGRGLMLLKLLGEEVPNWERYF